MHSWKIKNQLNIKKSAAFLLTFCFTILCAYPFDVFTPPVDISNEFNSEQQIKIYDEFLPHPIEEEPPVQPEHIASNTIYLDTSQINQAIFKGLIPSPSKYQKDTTDKTDSEFTPLSGKKTVLERTDSEENLKNDFTIFNSDNFASPSEYAKSNKIKSPVPEEVIAEEEYPASYQAYAESQNTSPNCDGKRISDIRINGLQLVNRNEILSTISTTEGSVFDENKLQQDLQAIYSLGYFTEQMEIEPTYNTANNTVSLLFNLKENPAVNNIELKGNSVISSEELMPFVKDLKNLPQNILTINQSIEAINEYYKKNGYVIAKVSNIDESENGTLIFEISEGVIEKIEFTGEHKTKDYVIERNMMTTPGSVYNEEILKKDLSRIYATQIFETVDREIEPSKDKDGEYVLKIAVKEASSNSISVGAGIDNALGIFGSISVLEKNFMGKGQQIGASGMIGSGLLMSDASIKNHMNYQVELFFREPHFINSDNSLLSKMYIRELGSYQIPLAIERRFGFNGVVTHKIKGNEKFTANLGIGYENIHLSEGDYNKISDMYKLRNIDFSNRSKQLAGGNFINFAPSIEYRNVDNDFMPRDGIEAKASFVESLCVDNIKRTNGRFVAGIKRYIPVFKKSTLSLTARGGIKVHGKEMPEVMAFALGGPYSIRGFRMSGVGTGNSFIMGSAELQTPIPFMDRFKYDVLKNLRFAFFVDAGQIYEPTISNKLFDRPGSAIVAGIGLRINIPKIGPISIDYGIPFTHVGQYNSKNGYFTFGTGGLYDSY